VAHRALRTFQEDLQFATQGAQPSTFHAAEAHIGIGQVLDERNQPDEALQHLTDGLTLCRQLVSDKLGWEPLLPGLPGSVVALDMA
jgi:hypothetical protein